MHKNNKVGLCRDLNPGPRTVSFDEMEFLPKRESYD
jgi:hypothetical protein